MSPFFSFFFLLLLITPAYAQTTLNAYFLGEGEAGGTNDEIVLDNSTTEDLTNNVVTVLETTETIGGIEVDLTQETTFVATQGSDVVTLVNTQLSSVTVEIPNRTVMSGTSSWNNELTPPKIVTTSGSVAAGFQTPTTSIQVGSPDVILVFDKVVTIILEGTTGQTAYKLSGTDNWVLISTCLGTYDSPIDPGSDECSISNGTDTKILTYHFTEFAELTETVVSTTETTTTETTTSSGHGPRSSSSRGGSILTTQTSDNTIPFWITNLISWWNDDIITDNEFKSSISYLMDENIIPTTTPKQPTALIDLAPSMKHIFSLWGNGQLSDSSVLDLFQYYRDFGVW